MNININQYDVSYEDINEYKTRYGKTNGMVRGDRQRVLCSYRRANKRDSKWEVKSRGTSRMVWQRKKS